MKYNLASLTSFNGYDKKYFSKKSKIQLMKIILVFSKILL